MVGWLKGRRGYDLPDNVAEVAQVAMQINLAKEQWRVPKQLVKELAALADNV